MLRLLQFEPVCCKKSVSLCSELGMCCVAACAYLCANVMLGFTGEALLAELGALLLSV